MDGGIEDDLRRNVDGGRSGGGATIDSCSTIPRKNIPILDDSLVMSVPEITYACMDAGRLRGPDRRSGKPLRGVSFKAGSDETERR